MLTLIVAAPRTGKSQFVVSKLYEYKQQGKRVFTTNFKQTPEQIEASGFEPYGNAPDWDWDKEATWRGDVSQWLEDLPHGAVWMIDEAQDVIPQRGKDRALPEWIKLFSKHGHKDLTIYIVTQDAMQLDVHLRRNCNFTLYMTRPLNMKRALVYTFRGSQEIPNDAWRRSQVLKTAESKKKFRYRSKWQKLYVSASGHEHIKLRLPWKLAIPVVGMVFVLAMLSFAYSRLKSSSTEDNPAATAAAAVIGAQAPTAAAAPSPVSESEEYMARFTPRVESMPWSAPAYDGFQVADYPRLYCIIFEDGSRCRCVTQQGNSAYVEETMCRSYALHGYWDPFKAPPGQQNNERGESGAPEQAPAYSSTGIGEAGKSARYGQFRDEPLGPDRYQSQGW